MKKILLLTVLCIATAVRAADAAPSPFAPIDWLAGGTWLASLPPDKNGATTRIELIVRRPENGAGLKFESAFLMGEKRRPYTCGMYAWDGARKKFVIFYTDAGGALSYGDVGVEGNVLVHEYSATRPSGEIEPIRVLMTHVSPNTFTNDISVRKDGAWVHVVTVRYERAE